MTPRWRPVELDGAAAAGQPDLVADLGDGADLRVRVLVARHEQHALLVADVHGQRDAHVREHDDVLERDQQKGVGHLSFRFHSYLREVSSIEAS